MLSGKNVESGWFSLITDDLAAVREALLCSECWCSESAGALSLLVL